MSATEKLGKYVIRGTLGRGAMGTVYDGWDPLIDRRVAIKTVRLADADDEETGEALERFKREAQAAGRLSHPNIVGVYDYGETADLAFIVMEFVEGNSLKAVLDQEKRLPPVRAAHYMEQVLAGLAYSHARGVVHRDIKPANIMLTRDGQVKIADFGIARIESSNMTSVGTVMGTPAYMPPEQFLGEAVDARSDIYAAGVMLFHLLTGERPYEGSMTSIMHKVMNSEAPPKASARAGVSPSFDVVIGRAMARAPGDRFASAADFAQSIRIALRAAEESAAAAGDAGEDATVVSMKPKAAVAVPVVAAATPAAVKPEAPAGKKATPVALLGGIAAVVLLAAGGAWFVLKPGGAPAPGPVPAGSVPAAPVAAPAPAVPAPVVSAPVVAPAPALPSAASVLPGVAVAVADLPCSLLSAAAGGSVVQIGGIVGAGSAEAAARQAAMVSARGVSVDWRARAVPGLYCGALDAIRPAGHGGRLEVVLAGGTSRLRENQPILPSVSAPDFPAWMTMDYLSNDGSFVHFYPNARDLARLHAPGSVLAMKAFETGTVQPPFGADMIVAVAASRPLFVGPHPAGETMQAYVAALGDAIKAAQARGDRVAAGVVVVDTEGK